MKADLTRKATLKDMQRLDSTAMDGLESLDGLEKAGHEPTTPASRLAARAGYNPDFLDGWKIDLPLPAEGALPVEGTGTPELKYTHFSVVMSESRRLPLVTAVNIDATQPKTQIARLKAWSFDGRIPQESQWGDALYDTNALDRGHMVRREDPIWGTPEEARQANFDTFHFTNSCPQMAGVNQKTWLGLENYVLHNARTDSMRVSVFTGPYFSDGDLEYRGAQVPAAFWKVVAIVTEDGRASATAYKIDQSKELQELEFVYAGYKTFQISIASVIEETGIDFSALVDYDGFSQHEAATGVALVEQIDDLESVRI